jgi:hypothetical protein
MRSLAILVAVAVALAASSAWAGVTYVAPGFVPIPVAPARVVYHYWPTAPVVTYPAPVVAYPDPGVPVAAPLAPAVPIIVPGAVYPAPAVIRTKVYYYGRPVRNTLRVVIP